MLHCAYIKDYKGEVMEKARKSLKITSIILLIFAGSSLLNIFGEVLFGDFSNAAIPEGTSANALLIAKIILLVFSTLMYLGPLYLFKGCFVCATAAQDTLNANINKSKSFFIRNSLYNYRKVIIQNKIHQTKYITRNKVIDRKLVLIQF